MSQRSAQASAMTTNRTSAAALGQVTVKKLNDDRFSNLLGLQSSAMCPLSEVGDAAHAIADRARCVAALGQVVFIRVDVGSEWAIRKPVDTVG